MPGTGHLCSSHYLATTLSQGLLLCSHALQLAHSWTKPYSSLIFCNGTLCKLLKPKALQTWVIPFLALLQAFVAAGSQLSKSRSQKAHSILRWMSRQCPEAERTSGQTCVVSLWAVLQALAVAGSRQVESRGLPRCPVIVHAMH